MNKLISLSTCFALLLAACSGTQVRPVPDLPVMAQMVTVVTPASDTLWGVEDPQTDAEWLVLDEAAIAIIDLFEGVKEGGTGPNDVDWAAEPDWDAMSDEVIAAGVAARAAIAARDLDSLYAAGDILYPPCENCHLKYSPGVINQEAL